MQGFRVAFGGDLIANRGAFAAKFPADDRERHGGGAGHPLDGPSVLPRPVHAGGGSDLDFARRVDQGQDEGQAPCHYCNIGVGGCS